MHIKSVIKTLSMLLIVISIIMLIPLTLSFVWGENVAQTAFTKTVTILFATGILGYLITKKGNASDFSLRDGFLFTTLTWVVVAAVGALPLYFTKTLPKYSDCFFELMSGITTTGATRLVDIESCYRSILFWRSLSNWLGGMGIVVLFVAILPSIGAGASGGSFNLIGTETVGPVKSKLTPKTKTTALVLWAIYIIMSVLETVLLLFGKVGLYDAVTITFSTVSTAGFSVKNLSIGAYNSAYIERVVTVFMLLAATNFSLYYYVIKGKWKEIKKDSEFKYFLSFVATTTLIGGFALRIYNVYPTIEESIRHMAFHVASIISTTGFTTVNYLSWPSFCLMILILLMFVGGCAGSTGGGIKVVRIAVLSKAAKQSYSKKIHQNGVYQLSMNNQIMDKDTVLSIANFCTIYMVTWLVGALIVSLTGASILDCLSSSILTLGNIGAGFSGKAFATYPHWCNWLFSALMLSGRLELLTVYVLFSKAFRTR